MPVLFGLFGLILIVAGVRGRVTQGNPSLVSLVKDDFTGSDPFWKWILAILFIGSVGYIPELKPLSRAFLVLLIVVFFLSNKGVFDQLQQTFTSSGTVPASPTDPLLEQLNAQGIGQQTTNPTTINPITGQSSANPEDVLLESINSFGIS